MIKNNVGYQAQYLNGTPICTHYRNFLEATLVPLNHKINDIFNTIFVSRNIYIYREPRRDSSNRRLDEHGIYIRTYQESNSQPVPFKREPIPLGHSDGRTDIGLLAYVLTFLGSPIKYLYIDL